MSTPNDQETEAEDGTTDDEKQSERSSGVKKTGDQNNISSDSGFELSSLLNMGFSGNVGVREGVSYGLGLLVYIVGLLLVTSILSAIGGGFLAASAGVDNIAINLLIGLFGLVISLISLVVFFAGIAGLQYKIIADGVSRGNEVE